MAKIEKMRDLSGFGGFGRFCSPITLIYQIHLAERILLLEEKRRSGRPSGARNPRLEKMTAMANSMFESGARITDVAITIKQTTTTVSTWTRHFEVVKNSYEMGNKVRT